VPTNDGNVLIANAYIGTQTSLAYQDPSDFPGYPDVSEAGPSPDDFPLSEMSSQTPPSIEANLKSGCRGVALPTAVYGNQHPTLHAVGESCCFLERRPISHRQMRHSDEFHSITERPAAIIPHEPKSLLYPRRKKETVMKRRDFLVQSIEAALLPYLGGSTGLAAAGQRQVDRTAKKRAAKAAGKGGVRTEQVHSHVAALNPVSAYLQSYVPPDGILDLTRLQTLTFEIVGWGTGKDRRDVSSPILGEVTMVRTPSSDAIQYEVTQRLGKEETMTGRFRCRTDRWHSLEEWQYEYALSTGRQDIDRLTHTSQSGRNTGENVTIRTDRAESVLACPTPLLCRYGVLDMSGRLNEFCKSEHAFTLLHEPSGLRPDQRFRPDAGDVLPGGRRPPIETVLQTGPATVPTHWIVDEQGRPLFVTAFLTSWALKSIV
jgi:hypothetical protein